MLEIGKHIREAREKRKISQKDASRETNINLSYIQAMEEGSTTFLPRVYIKNYYKMYATYLKIDINDSDLMIEDTKENVKVIDDDLQKQISQIKKTAEVKKNNQFLSFINDRYKLINRTNLINTVIFISIILVIIVVFYFTLFYDSTDKKSISTQDLQQVTNERANHLDTNSGLIYTQTGLIKLEARASDSVWIKINIDDKRNEEVILLTNTARSWAAENYFVISLSRAGAVELWRDGLLLPPLGGPYSKINELKITKDSIIKKAYISDSARNAIRHSNMLKQKQETAPMFLTPSNIHRPSFFQDKKKDSVR